MQFHHITLYHCAHHKKIPKKHELKYAGHVQVKKFYMVLFLNKQFDNWGILWCCVLYGVRCANMFEIFVTFGLSGTFASMILCLKFIILYYYHTDISQPLNTPIH
jgi:hypothetical protein